MNSNNSVWFSWEAPTTENIIFRSCVPNNPQTWTVLVWAARFFQYLPYLTRHIKEQGNNRRIIIAINDEAHFMQFSSEVPCVFLQLTHSLEPWNKPVRRTVSAKTHNWNLETGKNQGWGVTVWLKCRCCHLIEKKNMERAKCNYTDYYGIVGWMADTPALVRCLPMGRNSPCLWTDMWTTPWTLLC